VAPIADIDISGEKKIYSWQESNPGPSSPWPSHCTDYTIPALINSHIYPDIALLSTQE
jgi:hypothetical protein